LGDKREKHPESILVQNISEKSFCGKIFVLFCWLGLVFITLCLLFLYDFCHSPKNWLWYHPLDGVTLYFRDQVNSCLQYCTNYTKGVRISDGFCGIHLHSPDDSSNQCIISRGAQIADAALQFWSGNFPALMRTRYRQEDACANLSIQQIMQQDAFCNAVETIHNGR
jgi:hypothetical protein